jgi:hypothetical protein
MKMQSMSGIIIPIADCYVDWKKCVEYIKIIYSNFLLFSTTFSKKAYLDRKYRLAACLSCLDKLLLGDLADMQGSMRKQRLPTLTLLQAV